MVVKYLTLRSYMKVGLVSCVSKKKKGKHRAEDLYTSPLFIWSRAYVKRYYDKYFILSAKHYLVKPDQEIEFYNETLIGKTAIAKKAWAEETFRQILKAIKPDQTTLFIHVGMTYRKYLVPLLQAVGYKIEIPLAGLRIGEQLSWYDKQTRYAC